MIPSTETLFCSRPDPRVSTWALLPAVLLVGACGSTQPGQDPQEREDASSSEESAAKAAEVDAAVRDAEAVEPTDAGQSQQPLADARAQEDARSAARANPPASDATAAALALDAGDAGDVSPPGHWVGYVENYAFRSGSDALTLTLDALEPGRVAGRIMFGKGPAGPPPDPNSTLGDNSFHSVQEAYAYPLVDASLDGERLRFGVAAMKIWQDFCASFAPIADEVNEGFFSCMPNWSYTATGREEPGGCYLTNPMTRRNERFDCARYTFCNGVTGNVCKCDATKCGANDAIVVRYDVVVAGARMDGSMSGLGGTHNVHLKRQ